MNGRLSLLIKKTLHRQMNGTNNRVFLLYKKRIISPVVIIVRGLTTQNQTNGRMPCYVKGITKWKIGNKQNTKTLRLVITDV